MSTKIHLLILEDSFPLGGKERLILTLLKYLDPSIFVVHFIVLNPNGALVSSARKVAQNFLCLERTGKFDLLTMYRLRRYIVDNNIDIVHSNGFVDSVYLSLATVGLNVLRVGSIHGYSTGWRNELKLRILSRFDMIVAVSKSLKLDLIKMGISRDIVRVVYNCCDDEFYNRNTSIRQRCNSQANLIMVGNFVPCKDQETLINACSVAINRGADISLDLYGDGKFLQRCQALAKRLGILHKVQFLGSRPINRSILEKYDIFVFSTLYDTFGIALLEAMASGVPVLVSDIPACMEIIGNGRYGEYFEHLNEKDCADKLIAMIDAPSALERLSHSARTRAQEFHPAVIVKDFERMYFDLITKRGGR